MISLLETTNLWFTFKTQFHLIMNYNLSVTDPPRNPGKTPSPASWLAGFPFPTRTATTTATAAAQAG
jgi:hypothetical protein